MTTEQAGILRHVQNATRRILDDAAAGGPAGQMPARMLFDLENGVERLAAVLSGQADPGDHAEQVRRFWEPITGPRLIEFRGEAPAMEETPGPAREGVKALTVQSGDVVVITTERPESWLKAHARPLSDWFRLRGLENVLLLVLLPGNDLAVLPDAELERAGLCRVRALDGGHGNG